MNKLEFISKEVDNLKDGLGLGIDPKIRHAVIAFNYAGFITSMSCEGHMDWGYPFPWMEIDGEDTTKMENELDKFYAHREKELDCLKIAKYSGRYSVQACIDPPWVKDPNFVKDAALLVRMQKEMNAFADFLIKEHT